jgi:hypothetical protein
MTAADYRNSPTAWFVLLEQARRRGVLFRLPASRQDGAAGAFTKGSFMYPVSFSKPRVLELFDAIQNGNPIPAPAGGWSALEAIQAAGVFYFAAMSHGPPARWIDRERYESLHQEHLEMTNQQFMADLEAAIRYCRLLATDVADGDYDEQFEPEVTAAVEAASDAEPHATVKPAKGFKK